uniref:Sulfide:quinone oxidoreductase, mitochondrial n=1 Tax=Arcella intermedia TaxID=1963864 RepID=A0A6B2L5P3_9EUKA
MNAKGVKNITIVAPNEIHYYQPGWTLVGGGLLPFSATKGYNKDYIPKGVEWIKDSVSTFEPDQNAITLKSGKQVPYDYLVVATGIRLYWDQVKGLRAALGKDGVCSNYSPDTVQKTYEFLQQMKEGKIVFSQPATAVKCAGAPQKIMYLCDDYLRRNGLRDKVELHFYTSLAVIFGVPYYARALRKQARERGLNVNYRHSLVEVRPETKEAVFEHLDTKELVVVKYDMLHVVPPMGPVDEVKKSPLVDETGFITVDKSTMRHTKYPNIYALGDCCNAPTSKTAAAISSQAPVVVSNLIQENSATYDGYTSCPIITKKGGLILAEFDYNGMPKETFPYDQRESTLFGYFLKRYVFVFMYWHGTLTGRWKGPSNVKLPFIGRKKEYDLEDKQGKFA